MRQIEEDMKNYMENDYPNIVEEYRKIVEGMSPTTRVIKLLMPGCELK